MHGHSLQYMVTHCYALHSEWPSFIMIIIIKWPLCKEHASDRRRTRSIEYMQYVCELYIHTPVRWPGPGDIDTCISTLPRTHDVARGLAWT